MSKVNPVFFFATPKKKQKKGTHDISILVPPSNPSGRGIAHTRRRPILIRKGTRWGPHDLQRGTLERTGVTWIAAASRRRGRSGRDSRFRSHVWDERKLSHRRSTNAKRSDRSSRCSLFDRTHFPPIWPEGLLNWWVINHVRSSHTD